MGDRQVEYVVLLGGMDDAGRVGSTTLRLVADDLGSAETDIPWQLRDEWPERVTEAATRLRDRFVDRSDHSETYQQTGVRSVHDPQVREDFIAVAPYAFDATFWDHQGKEVASLADVGQSFVVRLTDQQRALLADSLGPGRVVALSEWHQDRPSLWRRWLGRHASGDRPGVVTDSGGGGSEADGAR